MFRKIFRKIFYRALKAEVTTQKKGWAKIEDFQEGPVSGTHYHDGAVYTIYNLMMSPGFTGATLSNTQENE